MCQIMNDFVVVIQYFADFLSCNIAESERSYFMKLKMISSRECTVYTLYIFAFFAKKTSTQNV